MAAGLAAVALLLCGVSFAAQLVSAVILRNPGPTSELAVLFVTEDQSIPSWYSSFALLFSSVLLLLVAHAVKRRGGGSYFVHWFALAAIFLYLSVDEGAAIHERLDPVGREMLRGVGLGSFGTGIRTWVVPAAVFALIVALAYFRFLRNLPRRTRNGFLLAGLLYVSGALGMEVVHDLFVRMNGGIENLSVIENLARALVFTHIEEFAEMIGIVVFIYTLLNFLGSLTGNYDFRIEDSKGKHAPN